MEHVYPRNPLARMTTLEGPSRATIFLYILLGRLHQARGKTMTARTLQQVGVALWNARAVATSLRSSTCLITSSFVFRSDEHPNELQEKVADLAGAGRDLEASDSACP